MYAKAPKKFRTAIDNMIRLFKIDPHNASLQNYPLKGLYKGKRSINITGNFRAIFSETKNEVTFYIFGTHSQLYK